MNTFLSFADDRLLIILWDATFKGTLLLALAAVVALAARRASAATRHLIFSAALVGALLLPALSLLLPEWRIPWMPQWLTAQAFFPRVLEPASFSPSHSPSLNASAEVPMPAAETFEPMLAPPLETTTIPFEPTVDLPQRPSTEPSSTLKEKLNPVKLAGAIWIAGVLLSLTPLAIGTLALFRLTRCSPHCESSNWITHAATISEQYGLRRPVTLRTSDAIRSPLTWGALRPVLLLPAAAENWSTERRQVVLLHELAHIKRFDWLTQTLAYVACSIYWFNPLAWWAARRMRVEREAACDDAVLVAGSRPVDYADELLKLASAIMQRRLIDWAGVPMARRSTLEGRLLAILDGTRNRAAVSRTLLLVAVLISIAVAIPVAMIKAAEQSAANQSAADQTAPSMKEMVPAPARKFVRIVIGPGALTFEGQSTTWEQLPDLLTKIADREHTVLELALSSDTYNMAQIAELQTRTAMLARQQGFEYASLIGVQPLGSKGTNAGDEVPWGEAENGISARVRAASRAWTVGRPIDLKLDIRNQSDRTASIYTGPQGSRLEIDGKLYHWLVPMGPYPAAGISAGEVKSDLGIPVSEIWGNVDGDVPLKLSPGKHFLRVHVPAGTEDETASSAYARSNPLEIEIQAVEEAPATVEIPIVAVSLTPALTQRIEQLLNGATVSSKINELEFYEAVPAMAGEYRIRAGVSQIGISTTLGGGSFSGGSGSGRGANVIVGFIYHLKDKDRFYIQWNAIGASTHHYYGPFEGDPAIVLGFAVPQLANESDTAAALSAVAVVPWGEAVQGVSAQLRADIGTPSGQMEWGGSILVPVRRPGVPQWAPNDVPELWLWVRNLGEREWDLAAPQLLGELEFDGKWYTIREIAGQIGSSRLTPSENLRGQIEVRLSRQWQSKDDDSKLPLTPGRHTVRIAFAVQARDGKEPKELRIVTNTVELPIVAPPPDDVPLEISLERSSTGELEYYLGPQKLTIEQLQTELAARPQSAKEPAKLAAAQGIPYRDVIKLVNVLQASGVKKLSLETRSESAAVSDESATADSPAWGKAVQGVAARLTPATAIDTRTVLPQFDLAVRNQGQLNLFIARAQELGEIEVDGVWYIWGGDIDIKSSGFEPSRQYDGIRVVMSPIWRSKEGSKRLNLTPGKHTVRFAVLPQSNTENRQQFRAVSNSVEINIPQQTPAAEPPPNNPLPYLVDVPEFHGFHMKMTEADLTTQIENHALLVRKTENDEQRRYHVYRADGENVILSFRDGTCSSIQRMRRDGAMAAKLGGKWGESVGGLQTLLWPYLPKWDVNENPSFLLFIKNVGDTPAKYLSMAAAECRLRIDGKWYGTAKLVQIGAQVRELKPGETTESGIMITLGDDWAELDDPNDWTRLGSTARGPKLALLPGRHTIEVMFNADFPAIANQQQPRRSTSNAVEFTVTQPLPDLADVAEFRGLAVDMTAHELDDHAKRFGLMQIAEEGAQVRTLVTRFGEQVEVALRGGKWASIKRLPRTDRTADGGADVRIEPPADIADAGLIVVGSILTEPIAEADRENVSSFYTRFQVTQVLRGGDVAGKQLRVRIVRQLPLGAPPATLKRDEKLVLFLKSVESDLAADWITIGIENGSQPATAEAVGRWKKILAQKRD